MTISSLPMRKILLSIAEFLSFFWRIIPRHLREKWITGWIVLDSRGKPGDGLRELFQLRDRVDWVINERAMLYGGGIHPKHRLTKYHQFFIDRIKQGESVLDVGCGYGAVSRSIAEACPKSIVVGIDHDESRLTHAREIENPKNVEFVLGDVIREVPHGIWDVIILSNVLEHIDDRVTFLKTLDQTTKPRRFLVRVPLFERDWQLALRRELKVDFRSDPDHRIEHTLTQFKSEIQESNLEIRELKTIWGEIWAECRPLKDSR